MKVSIKALVEQLVKEEVSAFKSTSIQDMSNGDTFKAALKKDDASVKAFLKGFLSSDQNDSPYQGPAFTKGTANHYICTFKVNSPEAKEFEESLKHKRTRDNMLDETGDEDVDGAIVADELLKLIDKAKGKSQASMIKKERGSEPGKYEPLKEAKPFKVNPKYNVFAVDKATNKVVNGWDLDPKDKENIKDYLRKTSEFLKQDLKDQDLKASDISMGTVKSLKAKGVDPFNWDSWKKPETNEATTTMVTPDGKTLSPEQKTKMKTATPGTNIVVKKAGELSEDVDLMEKKAKEEVPAENPEVPAEEAPVEDTTGGSASSELAKHISSAIDSAAKAIESSQDTKYEKVLGKVIKNLTAAQASLADVEAVENKLNEQIAKNDEKSADKFRKDLRKELKGSFKNPEHIDIILKKYDKVAKTASKENRPVQKIAEIITKHALHEGLIKKGDMIAG